MFEAAQAKLAAGTVLPAMDLAAVDDLADVDFLEETAPTPNRTHPIEEGGIGVISATVSNAGSEWPVKSSSRSAGSGSV